jgi:ABC-2 type transport system ATP-binding protein
MKMITGFITPDRGVVRIDGANIHTHPRRIKRRLGYLPEGAPLYGDMTTINFLEFIADVRALSGDTRRRRIGEVLDRVNLGSVVHQPIDTLSKGFKRRVGLAQAILHDPEVLVLDEPTDGLDPNQKHEVRTLIREMSRDKAIILSTHILEEVEAVCSRALIIAGGRRVADGTPADLESRSPLHNAVTLGIAGDQEMPAVLNLLSTLPGVLRAESLAAADGRLRVRIHPQPGADPLPGVTEAAQAQGWRLTELHKERGRLDQVFRDITAADTRLS